MANLFDFPDVRNHPSRNGFDVGSHRFFTAKAGELLPCKVVECNPGDRFKIDLASFTRSRPVQTAAFTRMREHVEFYFVPNRLLWSRWPDYARTLGATEVNNAASIKSSTSPMLHPSIMMDDVQDLLTLLKAAYAAGAPNPEFLYQLNEADQPMFSTTEKLLNYLGYGRPISKVANPSIDPTFPEDQPDTSVSTGTIPRALANDPLNPFPLLAYQKIYADHFHVQDWETPLSYAWNIDYITGDPNASPNLNLSAFNTGGKLNSTPWMFALRYVNWKKDLFMGLKPIDNANDVLALPNLSASNPSTSYQSLVARFTRTGQSAGSNVTVGNDYVVHLGKNLPNVPPIDWADGLYNSYSLYSQDMVGTSVFSIRRAEAFAKFLDIQQAGGRDSYKEYVRRHMDFDVPDGRAQLSEFLGSFSGDIVINEVMNQNLVSDDAIAKGTGISKMSGSTIDFTASEHGILMGVYYVLPELDYASSGIDPLCLKTDISQYFIPEFDKLGMQPMSERILSSNQDNASSTSQLLGYAPRYVDLKTGKDTIHGDFMYTRQDWVAPLSLSYLRTYLTPQPGANVPKLSYNFFKVHPSVLNPIFGVPVNGSVTTDQFDVAMSVQVSKVSGMDVDGMPY